MNHSFNVAIATEYGVNAAVLFDAIAFWCAHNEANERNEHDGLYWTYQSAAAFSEMYPYMSESQIRTAIKKLVDGGMIVVGNYNEKKWDRTAWYAVTEFGKSQMQGDENRKCKLQKSQMQVEEITNASCENLTPIPVINPVINTVAEIKEDHQERACEETVPEVPFDQMDATNAPDNDTARVCKAYRQQIGEIPNGKAFDLLCTYIDDIGADAVVIGIEETNIAQPSNGWQYLKKLLDGFAERGVHDADSARAAVNDHKSAARARSSPKAETPQKFNYQQHSYTDADFGKDFYFDPTAYYAEREKANGGT